jgi:hypothetical protein
MKLYSAKITPCAAELIRQLVEGGDIEVGNASEAQLDVEAVLKEYLRTDRSITDRAKDMMEQKGLSYAQFGKIKRALAEEQGFAAGEEGLGWILNQLVETLMHSQHVDEVFADDAILRRKMREVLRRHMALDEELDHEVRRRIKNLEEGTTAWDIEYQKVMEQLKRNKGAE